MLKKMEFLKRLDTMLDMHRVYGFNHVELLRYILKKFGYKMHVTPKGMIRLKKVWINDN